MLKPIYFSDQKDNSSYLKFGFLKLLRMGVGCATICPPPWWWRSPSGRTSGRPGRGCSPGSRTGNVRRSTRCGPLPPPTPSTPSGPPAVVFARALTLGLLLQLGLEHLAGVHHGHVDALVVLLSHQAGRDLSGEGHDVRLNQGIVRVALLIQPAHLLEHAHGAGVVLPDHHHDVINLGTLGSLGLARLLALSFARLLPLAGLLPLVLGLCAVKKGSVNIQSAHFYHGGELVLADGPGGVSLVPH